MHLYTIVSYDFHVFYRYCLILSSNTFYGSFSFSSVGEWYAVCTVTTKRFSGYSGINLEGSHRVTLVAMVLDFLYQSSVMGGSVGYRPAYLNSLTETLRNVLQMVVVARILSCAIFWWWLKTSVSWFFPIQLLYAVLIKSYERVAVQRDVSLHLLCYSTLQLLLCINELRVIKFHICYYQSRMKTILVLMRYEIWWISTAQIIFSTSRKSQPILFQTVLEELSFPFKYILNHKLRCSSFRCCQNH